ncbi:MAG: class I SAM-dependent methyltransferase [Fibrobacteria bacterium]
MDNTFTDRILSRYPHASLLQRWHMRGRLRLCPYDTLLKHLTGGENLLDIGCGFGHLAWYLADSGSRLRYYGADIDARKVDLALGTLAVAGAGGGPVAAGDDFAIPTEGGGEKPIFLCGDIQELRTLPDHFGNIVMLDVLYLMPWESQMRMMAWALGRLSPGKDSALIIKTMDPAEGFSGFRAVAEEWIMVRLLRRTMSSGELNGMQPFSAYTDFAAANGFRCEREALPTFNPSSILRIHR